jgi:microcystin-dependent protein
MNGVVRITFVRHTAERAIVAFGFLVHNVSATIDEQYLEISGNNVVYRLFGSTFKGSVLVNGFLRYFAGSSKHRHQTVE